MLIPPRSNDQLLRFLREDLVMDDAVLDMALRYREQDPGPLPMILWQYGLVSLHELQRIFDWLEG